MLSRDELYKALLIYISSPVDQPFSDNVVKFFDDILRRECHEKYKGDWHKIVKGDVIFKRYNEFQPERRILRLTFNNGYIWLVNLLKVSNDKEMFYDVLSEVYTTLIDQNLSRKNHTNIIQFKKAV